MFTNKQVVTDRGKAGGVNIGNVTGYTVSIIPIVPKFPHVTIEVLDNHGLMDSVRVDVGTLVMMLVTSDIENSLNISSTRWLG